MIKKESYAFPIVVNENTDYFHGGLTKREYFAAMAMQGYLVNNATIGVKDEEIARWSINQADAIIKALNESQP